MIRDIEGYHYYQTGDNGTSAAAAAKENEYTRLLYL